MLRRSLIAAPLAALALAGALPATAIASPVPLGACTPGVAAQPCLPAEHRGDDPLAAAARSGAGVLWRFWSTAALVLF
jgi:hypothetical protein